MLTMVNSTSEHQSNSSMATTDAYLQQQPASHAHQEPQPEPQPEPQSHQQQQSQQQPFTSTNDENVQPRQRNIPVPVLVKHEEYAGASAMLQVSLSFAGSSGGDQSGEESSSSMRSATTPSSLSSSSKRPREKRSTKSKCPPGLRSGKWTPEEEAFTNMIIYYFKLGRLHVEDGTSLRWYLAKRLNCEAMRVTKKLKGNSSIGKQIFRALEDTEESRRAIAEAAEALAVVEKAFVDSLSATGQAAANSNSSSNSNQNQNQNAAAPLHASASVSAAIAATARSKKSSPHKPMGLPKPPHLEARKLVIPKVRNSLANSEDAKLLMHFFVEAHDPNMEKKRLFSDVDTSPSASSTSSSSHADDASPANKRRSVKMEDLVVGTI